MSPTGMFWLREPGSQGLGSHLHIFEKLAELLEAA
jgi:hypothetical protein